MSEDFFVKTEGYFRSVALHIERLLAFNSAYKISLEPVYATPNAAI